MSRGLYVKRMIVALMLCLGTMSVYSQAKRALLVGISEYPQESEGAWSPIHGANDVELIYPTLKRQGFEIIKLCNIAAEAKNIREELAELIESCNQNDTIYLHFSCHGQPVVDFDGDEGDGWDESIVPYDAQKHYREGFYVGENHITDDELHRYLHDIRIKVGPHGFVYVVLDACHAGSSYRGENTDDKIYTRGTNKGFSSSNKLFVPRIDKRGTLKVEKADDMSDICILEACRAYQVNCEICEDDNYFGSLSYYVNATLTQTSLSESLEWTEEVRKSMESDIRLVRQNLVIETSK